jgi:prophage regulatory protein
MSDGSNDDPPRRRRAPRVQPPGVVEVSGAQLTLETVMQITGLGKTTIYKLVKSGDFPAPIHVSKRSVRWPADELRPHLCRAK